MIYSLVCISTWTHLTDVWDGLWVILRMSFVQNKENERKHLQELDQQRVASQMAQLKMAKLELEQEVDTHKKRLRLHMEAEVRTHSNSFFLLFLPMPSIDHVYSLSKKKKKELLNGADTLWNIYFKAYRSDVYTPQTTTVSPHGSANLQPWMYLS